MIYQPNYITLPKTSSAYKKILVPYDGSEPSDKALLHAIRISKMSIVSDGFAHVICCM